MGLGTSWHEYDQLPCRCSRIISADDRARFAGIENRCAVWENNCKFWPTSTLGVCICSTEKQEIFVSEKFRQKRPSGSSSGIYFRQVPVFARLLFDHSVVALLLIVYLPIHESISCSTLVVIEKISQEFNLVKNCFDESDEIKFLTKISCYTVVELASAWICNEEEYM